MPIISQLEGKRKKKRKKREGKESLLLGFDIGISA